ncbi:hypothetical protein ONE63_003748 [Megalurothrips usitatus]|uniref:Uncharacterized protein n=1 Tax=Megalurothrips usitatus TaxID=439358 RepID=A0AAV7XAI5_9NEOP|nr:hypothetical protein ONE63_003748 [Megalurothrips usitatus]KAJ1520641.1 hypothetical protein ONE63_003748 [Megalurothrips usitatus]
MQTLVVQNSTNVTKENSEGVKAISRIVVHSKKGSSELKNEHAGKNGLMTQGSHIKSNSALAEGTMAAAIARNGIKRNESIMCGKQIPIFPENRNGSLSNGLIPFKSFKGSATIGDGTVRYVTSSVSSSVNTSTIATSSQNQILKDKLVFKSPASVPPNETRKKMKIFTVPKKVPLINTVGNQSKFIPMTLPTQSQPPVTTVESNAVSPTWVNSPAKYSAKPLSILHARLTSPSAVTSQPVKEISKASSDVPSSPQVPVSLQGSGDSEAVVKQRTYLTASESAFKKAADNLKPVLNFEKGLTRLVAVESRTVTMVDVSTQVFIPEDQGQEDKEFSAQTTPLPAASTDTSGSAASPTVPLSQKQYVVVDTKNGKKVLAIPKQIMRNYTGPKTFVIEGKAVKTGADSSLEYLPNIPYGIPEPVKLKQHSADQSVSSGGTSSIMSDSHLSGNGVEAAEASSVPTSSITSITQAPSKSSESPSTLAYCATLSGKLSPVQLSSTQGNTAIPFQRSASIVQPISSNADTLILPLNLPIKNISPSSSEGIPLHSVQNSSPLFFIVPNSQDSLESAISNGLASSELSGRSDILLKSNVGFKRKDNIAPAQVPPSKKLCSESLRFDTFYPPILPKPEQNLSKERVIRPHMNVKDDEVVHNSSQVGHDRGDAVNGHNLDGTLLNFSDIINSNGGEALNMSSKVEVDKFVKSIFSEFKNCLSLNAEGKLPIHAAVENNDIAAVTRQCILLKARRSSVNLPNLKDESPLQLALIFGHSSLVKVLLQHGADATAIDHEGNTTLHLAVMHAEDALESLLLSKQLSKKLLNCLNDDGFSALHLAAQHDKVQAINLLVIHGAEVDLPDGRSGRTALFHAVDRKNYSAQKALIDCGADMKEPTFTGTTPFLVTRSDAIAQLTNSQDTIVEEIDLATLLATSKHPRVVRIR